MGNPENLERRLFRQLRATCEGHGLLAPGDRVLVAVSGGKDSYTLLFLLQRLVRALPFPVELVAVHLDQRQPGYNGAPLIEWLEQSGVSFEILSEDTYSIVTEKLAEGSTYCSLCSRLRRGILYSAAARLGCNKLALGHHREDGLETFLLNLFYGGKLQAMPARFTSDDGRVEVLRPLIECAEADIAAFAAQQRFPILPCNLCGSQEGLKRERVAELLSSLEREHPSLRAVMASALANVRPTHLLDPAVREAWLARPGATGGPRPATEEHFAALPVHSRRLPVLGSLPSSEEQGG
ncbi:MAG: tRNA 2-thiocytidine(32) synthetase TtcA [Polyangiaceae bacterium]|jgi:tRNA 2-thiocytidine biosynthesis protein TtcA|nr:tRNA 2-thiocytidine(32) synthetase TtcA [Polyangiaceae bacterium]